jgi:hypothetical protein
MSGQEREALEPATDAEVEGAATILDSLMRGGTSVWLPVDARREVARDLLLGAALAAREEPQDKGARLLNEAAMGEMRASFDRAAREEPPGVLCGAVYDLSPSGVRAVSNTYSPPTTCRLPVGHDDLMHRAGEIAWPR